MSEEQTERFVRDGFLKIESAFPRELAEECRSILWRDLGCDEHDPTSWAKPVIRLGGYSQEPFVQAANTPVLHEVFDRLVGAGRWLHLTGLGTFPVRFPSPEEPGDTGWHVDASFPPLNGDAGSFLNWRVNIASKGRALLLLFLFSDIGPDDAPTRIRVGSHIDVARRLAPMGDNGMSLLELAGTGFAESDGRLQTLATGQAGTVYACHPFLVHAAQPHRGTRPRFLAQPPLRPVEPLLLERANGVYSPVEQAIRLGSGLFEFGAVS